MKSLGGDTVTAMLWRQANMTSLTKHKQQQQEMVKTLSGLVLVGKEQEPLLLMIKSRQPKNGVKQRNSLDSTYAMLPFFFSFTFQPMFRGNNEKRLNGARQYNFTYV